MWDILRESTVGELVNYASGGRILPYPDQRPDFVVPEKFLASSSMSNESTHVMNDEKSPNEKPATASEDLEEVPSTPADDTKQHLPPSDGTSTVADAQNVKNGNSTWGSGAPTRIPSSEAVDTPKSDDAVITAKAREAGDVDDKTAARDVEGHPQELDKALETAQVDIGNHILVDWYGEDDPENPRNWSSGKRAFVLFEICLLT